MQLSTTYLSFIQALNVMNAVLERYRDAPLFKPMLSAAANQLADCDLVVAIVESKDSLTPHDHVTIRLQDGTFVLVAHGKKTDDVAWTVSESYLDDVATHPRCYVDNPARLDFDWLKRLVERPPRKRFDTGLGDSSRRH